METTEIRIHLRDEDRLKAFVTVTFDNCFVVRNMKIVQGTSGLILCMPSRKLPDGTYKDIAHPITSEFRKILEDKIMAAYQEEIKKQPPEKRQEKNAAPSGRGKPPPPPGEENNRPSRAVVPKPPPSEDDGSLTAAPKPKDEPKL